MKKIGEIHVRWYEPDGKFLRAIRRAAKKSGRTFQEQVKFMLREMVDAIEWDEQIANDVKAGKFKGLYPKERF